MLKKLINKPTPVEVIHAEFDNAEEKILQECAELLKNTDVITETQLEKKAKILKELGFNNSEPVKQAESFFKKRKEKKLILVKTKLIAETINELKVKYPNEKFITVDELERICNKYNLIHAPVANYIKDIPEKNVLEMSNVKKLEKEDNIEELIQLNGIENNKLLKLIGHPDGVFTQSQIDDLCIKYHGWNVDEWTLNARVITWLYVISKSFNLNHYKYYSYDSVEIINKNGLFIAAPKSHFNLNKLNKKSKFGYFKVTKQEVKDPVVFEYCKNNIVRIITKWGTDDDQSYLDSSLTNEKMN